MVAVIHFSLPPEVQVDYRSGHGNGIEVLECLDQNGLLLSDIKGFSQRMPKRPPEKNSPRRFHLLGVFPDDGDAYCRNTRLLDYTLNQTDGLVTDTSSRSE
jgi:hypothetical protein